MSNLDQTKKSAKPVKCPACTNLRRDPPAGHGVSPADQIAAQKKKIADMEAELARNQATVASSPAGSAAAIDARRQIDGLIPNLKGIKFELKVAEDEHAKGRMQEVDIKITCDDCKQPFTNVDVVTTDDQGNTVLKECKASGSFDQAQIERMKVVSSKFFGSAAVHVTGPTWMKSKVTSGWPEPRPAQQRH